MAKRWSFGEWFGRKDAAERRGQQYGDKYDTKIVRAPKWSGWKWGLWYRRK